MTKNSSSNYRSIYVRRTPLSDSQSGDGSRSTGSDFYDSQFGGSSRHSSSHYGNQGFAYQPGPSLGAHRPLPRPGILSEYDEVPPTVRRHGSRSRTDPNEQYVFVDPFAGGIRQHQPPPFMMQDTNQFPEYPFLHHHHHQQRPDHGGQEIPRFPTPPDPNAGMRDLVHMSAAPGPPAPTPGSGISPLRADQPGSYYADGSPNWENWEINHPGMPARLNPGRGARGGRGGRRGRGGGRGGNRGGSHGFFGVYR